jgi:hypothetical protein
MLVTRARDRRGRGRGPGEPVTRLSFKARLVSLWCPLTDDSDQRPWLKLSIYKVIPLPASLPNCSKRSP